MSGTVRRANTDADGRADGVSTTRSGKFWSNQSRNSAQSCRNGGSTVGSSPPWGDDTLLPDALIRDHVSEPVDILSGGTREQLALPVRLAFARMLAKGGRHTPVILDDALVFTDGDRIERMFDALHRRAGDLQIIVLSCRQRAFRALGGHLLRLEPVVPD